LFIGQRPLVDAAETTGFDSVEVDTGTEGAALTEDKTLGFNALSAGQTGKLGPAKTQARELTGPS
jgi:hypothetical protein